LMPSPGVFKAWNIYLQKTHIFEHIFIYVAHVLFKPFSGWSTFKWSCIAASATNEHWTSVKPHQKTLGTDFWTLGFRDPNQTTKKNISPCVWWPFSWAIDEWAINSNPPVNPHGWSQNCWFFTKDFGTHNSNGKDD
jgi:hypothetical protein